MSTEAARKTASVQDGRFQYYTVSVTPEVTPLRVTRSTVQRVVDIFSKLKKIWQATDAPVVCFVTLIFGIV